MRHLSVYLSGGLLSATETSRISISPPLIEARVFPTEIKAREYFMEKPALYIVIPCYNEEKVLPITAPMFKEKIESLIDSGKIAIDSRVLFVNDGSKDSTWDFIQSLSSGEVLFEGLSLSRNRGHQNALLAGLMEVKNLCDITISIDCDGQDDINAMDRMVDEYIIYKWRGNCIWCKKQERYGHFL